MLPSHLESIIVSSELESPDYLQRIIANLNVTDRLLRAEYLLQTDGLLRVTVRRPSSAFGGH